MLWIIVRIAALITALMSSASAEEGLASRYGRASGTQVACGGSLNESALTAAHRSLPCGSRVRVTSRRNGNSVVVTITTGDRLYVDGWSILRLLQPAPSG